MKGDVEHDLSNRIREYVKGESDKSHFQILVRKKSTDKVEQ